MELGFKTTSAEAGLVDGRPQVEELVEPAVGRRRVGDPEGRPPESVVEVLVARRSLEEGGVDAVARDEHAATVEARVEPEERLPRPGGQAQHAVIVAPDAVLPVGTTVQIVDPQPSCPAVGQEHAPRVCAPRRHEDVARRPRDPAPVRDRPQRPADPGVADPGVADPGVADPTAKTTRARPRRRRRHVGVDVDVVPERREAAREVDGGSLRATDPRVERRREVERLDGRSEPEDDLAHVLTPNFP